MKVVEALNIGWQIASALLAAHNVGIIHRDLKPENIMLCMDGQVKVLDFGIAKLVRTSSEVVHSDALTWSKTDPKTLVGTVAYMSPEQVKHLPLDERTDIFNLGVLIYETITGLHPFLDETSSDLVAPILEKEPLPLGRFTTETIPELEWIVTKALNKEREDRYQSAKDFAIDLKRLIRKLDMEAAIKRTRLATDRGPSKSHEALGDASPVIDQDKAEVPHSTDNPSTFRIFDWLTSELKFSRLQVVAILVFTLLTGLTVYFYVNRELKTREFYLGASEKQHEEEFEEDLDKTINLISLLSPTDRDRDLVNKLKAMQVRFSSGRSPSEKFDELLRLADVLHKIVVERKPAEANVQIALNELGISSDKFVASRALLLKTPILFDPPGFCGRPDETLAVIQRVFDRDRGVIPAYNIKSVCLAQKSYNLLNEIPGAPSEKQPQLWADSVKYIGDSLKLNKSAFEYNQTPETKIRFLNNKVWNSMQFLSGVVGLSQENMSEALKRVEHGTMKDFFVQSVDDIENVLALETEVQPAFIETLAELYGLTHAYYTDDKYKDHKEGQKAEEKVFENLIRAIDQGLLELRGIDTLEKAEKYFHQDSLLKPLFVNPLDPSTLHPRLKQSIEQRLARQLATRNFDR